MRRRLMTAKKGNTIVYYEKDDTKMASCSFYNMLADPKKLTVNKANCESIFSETTVRTDDGPFMVKIPLKDDPNKLSGFYQIAKPRYESMENKLEANTALKTEYSNFMWEYVNLNHIKELHTHEHSNRCYLPHHSERELAKRKSVAYKGNILTLTPFLDDNNVI
ncbi:hypothetical protein Trydic_g8779 [Trypoxylus dichotomus]